MERLYCVEFDTQRDRHYIHWEFFVYAHNMKEAREKASSAWNSPANPKYKETYNIRTCRGRYYPHMFHVEVKRVTEPVEKETQKFYKVSDKHAYWGWK